MLKLYEIEQELFELQEIWSRDDLTPEEEEAILERMDELLEGKKEKLINFRHAILNYDRTAEAFKEEAKRLAEESARYKKKSEKLMSFVMRCLNENEALSIEGKGFKWSTSKAVVLTGSVEDLPEEYIRVKVIKEPDKIGLRDALMKKDADIKGAKLEVRHHLKAY